MRKLLLPLLCICPLLMVAQIKKEKAPVKAGTPLRVDSVNFNGVIKRDTSKVLVLAFAVDPTDNNQNLFITVLRGYVIQTVVLIPGTNAKIDAGTTVYTQKWEAIKPEDVFDVRKVDWK